MPTFIFPTSTALRAIDQELIPRLIADDLLFQIFPIETSDDYKLVWEQKDNYQGLQQLRGLDGAFARVNKVGVKRYDMEPGVYGEFEDLNETEMTRRRMIGTFQGPVDVSDLVRDAQDQLLQRRLDRIRYIGWTLLSTGTFSVALPSGGVAHTDTYTVQTAAAAVAWGTFATAKPISDLRAVQQLGPARGSNFGAGAMAILNRATANKLYQNTNAADLGGRRLQGLQPVNNLEQLNTVLMGEDLPMVKIWDEGYQNDSGTFTRFIPNDKVVIVGQRPGNARIGAYRMVRNINNPGMAPGPYTEVIQQREPPKRINVYDGHNGGPIIEYPGSVVILTVS